jgi:hypothetical protein
LGTKLPLSLALIVALLFGVLPLQVCEPSCGEGGGIVVAGTHAHAGHDHGDCGHEHGKPSPDAPHDEKSCCEDAAGVTATTVAKVCLPSALDGHVVAWLAHRLPTTSSRDAARPAEAETDSGPPREVVGIVLLR